MGAHLRIHLILVTAFAAVIGFSVRTPIHEQISPKYLAVAATSDSGDSPTIGVIEAEDVDIRESATSMGITETEMRIQIGLQDAMDSIDYATIDPGYAEIGSTPGKSFRIWYRSSLDPTEELKSAMSEAGILPFVDFIKVPLSLSEIMDRAWAVYNQIRDQDIPVGVTIDTAAGGVVLHPMGKLDVRMESQAMSVADKLEVPSVWGDPPPELAYIGGKFLHSVGTNQNCTGGFTVVSGGNRMMTTAAHCVLTIGDSLVYASDEGFKVVSMAYDSNHDVATFDKSGVGFTNQVDYGSTNRYVYDVRPRVNMHVGDQVSKYGQTTGFTVGTIYSVSACGHSGCDPSSTWIGVDKNAAGMMCDHGDSGGPFMYGSVAYGITAGFHTTGAHVNDCVFMPEDNIAGGVYAAIVTQ